MKQKKKRKEKKKRFCNLTPHKLTLREEGILIWQTEPGLMNLS